jgi:hypothetical protein
MDTPSETTPAGVPAGKEHREIPHYLATRHGACKERFERYEPEG